MRLTVSAVIPSYNRAAFLPQALDSVWRQTRVPDEVLVVDDCSTDGSPDVARRLGARVLSTARNSGCGAAKNVGLRAAGGDVIVLLDSDDYWDPSHCELVVGALENFPEAAVSYSLVRMFGDADEEWVRLYPEMQPVDAFWDCLRATVIPSPAAAIRRDAALRVGGFDERYRRAEDYEFWLRLTRHERVVCTGQVTGHWRRHAGQTTTGSLKPGWEEQYVARRRFWQAAAAREPAESVALLRDAIETIWERNLWAAWRTRNAQLFDFHLNMHEYVPGSEAAFRRWRRARRLVPALTVWDRVPERLRRVVGRIAPVVRPPG